MWSHVLSLAAGSLTTLSPCVLPILPLVVGSAGQQHRLAPAAMAAGMAAAFAVVGVLTAGLGTVLGADPAVLRQRAAVLMGIAGLFLVVPPLRNALARWLAPLAGRAQSASGSLGTGLVGHALSGALLGVVWSPCVGPTLGAAAALASRAGGVGDAAVLMLLFGLGAAAPMLLIAYGLRAWLMAHRAGVLRAGEAGRRLLGISLVVIALVVLTGIDRRIEGFLVGIMPQAWLDLTTRL